MAHSHPAFHGAEQAPHHLVAGRDLDLHTPPFFQVDDTERATRLAEEVLQHIQRALLAFGAQAGVGIGEEGFPWILAGGMGAVRGVFGICADDVAFIVMWETRV